jgi:DNA processing protein
MEAMLTPGGVVSEVPMGVQPAPQRFPLRDRLISGMAEVVVVVQGGVDSGSLITARYAADQQRSVYAVPGSVLAPESRGSHPLLAEGARVLRDPAELLQRFALVRSLQPGGTRQPGLNEDESRVPEVLGNTPAHIESIIEQAGLGAGRVAGALGTLEVRGLIRQGPGKRFARRSEFHAAGAQLQAGGDTWPSHSLL